MGFPGGESSCEDAFDFEQLNKVYKKLRYSSEELFLAQYMKHPRQFSRCLIWYIPARLRGYAYYLKQFRALRNSLPSFYEKDLKYMPDNKPHPYPPLKWLPSTGLEFEGSLYPVPSDYKEVLRADYGDFM